MRIGVPREVKNHEYRVAATPACVHELTVLGHDVVVERGAGEGSAIGDDDYTAAGAKILDDADQVWAAADLVLKVKEPIAEEYHRLRPDLTLFTYLHLAASEPCTRALLDRGHQFDCVRDCPGTGRLAAAALPDERGGGPARTAGRCALPHATRRRPRCAHRRRHRR